MVVGGASPPENSDWNLSRGRCEGTPGVRLVGYEVFLGGSACI